jgi:hypothetical protein
MAAEINERTVGGLLAYCDWLRVKNYQSANGVEAWKTAIKKVFESVDGASYEDVSLDGIDLDEYVDRFRVAAGGQYKAETVAVYGRRIKNAMEAQAEYVATGKQSILARRARTPKGEGDQAAAKPKPKQSRTTTPQNTNKVTKLPLPADFFEFTYPLSPGRIVRMELPFQMSKREVDRLCTVLQTLEEQPQLPQRAAA